MECKYIEARKQSTMPSIITNICYEEGTNEIKVITADNVCHTCKYTDEMQQAIEEILKMQLYDYCKENKIEGYNIIINTSIYALLEMFFGIKMAVGAGDTPTQFLAPVCMVMASIGVIMSVATRNPGLKAYSYFLKHYDELTRKEITLSNIDNYSEKQLKSMLNEKNQDKKLVLAK